MGQMTIRLVLACHAQTAALARVAFPAGEPVPHPSKEIDQRLTAVGSRHWVGQPGMDGAWLSEFDVAEQAAAPSAEVAIAQGRIDRRGEAQRRGGLDA